MNTNTHKNSYLCLTLKYKSVIRLIRHRRLYLTKAATKLLVFFMYMPFVTCIDLKHMCRGNNMQHFSWQTIHVLLDFCHELQEGLLEFADCTATAATKGTMRLIGTLMQDCNDLSRRGVDF